MLLISIIAVSALWVFSQPSMEAQNIKIGVCADIGSMSGDNTWKGAVLAAEQINSEGGILGRQIELVREDTDAASGGDISLVNLAVNRLITYHKVDFIIGGFLLDDNRIMQDLSAEHKILCISVSAPGDVLTQQVLDDYNKYKYFFKVSPPNSTASKSEFADSIVACREYTGFNKIAYVATDNPVIETRLKTIEEDLPNLFGFDFVYGAVFPPQTVDFSSYFAAAEAAGAEILIPSILGEEGVLFTKEWYNRQSPMVLWGGNVYAALPFFWNMTEGKCAYETAGVPAAMVGYPITSKTLPMREAFIERWNNDPDYLATGAYDIIKIILPEALDIAGTLETEEVIKALEKVDVETTTAKRFIFTSSHDILHGEGYNELYFFQWKEDGLREPMFPRSLKEIANATYSYPDWFGPWT